MINLSEYSTKLEEVLSTPLDIDSPDNLYKQATVIESLSYYALKLQAEAEANGAKAERALREAGVSVSKFGGTAVEKKLLWEASCAGLFEVVDKYKTEAKYWYGVSKSIERKVILAQSILSNMTANIKAGVR